MLNCNNKVHTIPSLITKCFCVLLLVVTSGVPSFSQTLFTYGKHTVSKDEFLRAYNKNNFDTSGGKLAFQEYLELYIRFKLKVQAALDARMDTIAEQNAELQSFRYQLAENFIREDASINILVEEAFDRSLKDIHLSHVFVPAAANSTPDSIALAQKNINAAYERLQKGEAFDKVAASYSGGSLGYITAFVLPYANETIAYSTKTGKHSAPFRTNAGFHIIRNDGERKAVGKMRAAQILFAFPPNATENDLRNLQRRADSVYSAIQNGADFGELAKQYSDDHLTFFSGGEMPAFGVGQYDTIFENNAFNLARDGDVTRPFKTTFGYHIVKRLQRVPVIEDKNNKEWLEVIRERVLQSDRMQVAQARLIENIRQIIRKDAATLDISNDSAVLDYYRNNLEKYNTAFAEQLNEFREGNLLFSIMQKQVWDAAVDDSAALRSFYTSNMSKYNWENSADALIVTCLIADSVQSVQNALKQDHRSWRALMDAANGLIQVDSGRFELSQIPVLDRTNFTDGLMTAPVINEPDSSRTFAYVIKLYKGRSPKSFKDARGTVINDYQVFLEEQWVNELKRKYPVTINRKTLAKLR